MYADTIPLLAGLVVLLIWGVIVWTLGRKHRENRLTAQFLAFVGVMVFGILALLFIIAIFTPPIQHPPDSPPTIPRGAIE